MCIHLTLSLKSFPCPYLHPFLSLSLSLSPSLSPSVTHSLSLSLTLVSHPKCQMGTGSRALPVRTALPVRALIEHPLQGLYHPDLGSRNQNGIGSTELPGSEYMTSPREVIKAVCLSLSMPPYLSCLPSLHLQACLPAYLPAYLFIYLIICHLSASTFVCLPVSSSAHQYASLSTCSFGCPSIFLPASVSVCPSVCLSVCLPVCQSTFLPFYLSVYWFLHLSIALSVCTFVSQIICPPVYQSIYLPVSSSIHPFVPFKLYLYRLL